VLEARLVEDGHVPGAASQQQDGFVLVEAWGNCSAPGDGRKNPGKPGENPWLMQLKHVKTI